MFLPPISSIDGNLDCSRVIIRGIIKIKRYSIRLIILDVSEREELNKAFLNGPVDIMWVVHQRDLSRGEGVPSYARLEPKRRSEVKRVFVTSFNEHTGRWISIKNFELPPSSQFPPPVIRLDEVLKWWKKAVGQTKFPNFETRKWKIKKIAGGKRIIKKKNWENVINMPPSVYMAA